MSIQAVAWVLDNSQSRGFARLVLISLANHYNAGTGQCNPGQRAIAQEAGVSLGSIAAQVRKLVALGEVTVEEPGGSHRSARYVLNFVQQVDVVPKVRSELPSSTSKNGQSTFSPGLDRTMNQEKNLERGAPNGARSQRRGTQVPNGFEVTDTMLAWVQRECPHIDWDHETKKFWNYWQAEGGVKKNWVAAWRTWMLKAVDFQKARPSR